MEGKINFFSENDFQILNREAHISWLENIITSEEREPGELNFIFCDDDYLHKINLQYLNHDTFTDIISFDNSEENIISGDIFISTERVAENAAEFREDFSKELRRVLAHGILHFCGYNDKNESEAEIMRQKEEEKIAMFHVEQ